MKFKFGQKVILTAPFYNNTKGVVINSETMASKTIYTVRVKIGGNTLDIKEVAKFVKGV